ncbi:OmpA family protein [Nitrospirillum viridazoti]|uniref:Cell envelope biogenesis protein OmpA n=1 Tax=Nitrospirillum viridazoti CBAmc TaxID=1441467 RepID=A0A248K3G8_9PROT|nr:OmpA family protein [Nitrospirillum amazonense]ASG24978.1 cell envelope biogenesis protein OmpA [Nitrospirillum amazonense CBAmc]TWB31273.1 uncharacterized protein DUF4892 [Nitrospirillum amazonense]
MTIFSRYHSIKARNYQAVLTVALPLLAATPVLAAGDVPGSKDHPLVSRFAGATITAYEHKDFDEAFLPDRPVKDEDKAEGLHLEGKVTRVWYTIATGKSTLEVERNYQDALQKAGFQMVFRCAKEECGDDFQRLVINSGKVLTPGKGNAAFGGAHRTILAKLPRPTGDAYVFLHIMEDSSNQRTLVNEEVVEIQPMQTGQVQIMDSGTMKNSLASSGKVALYGIYFDTDKAEVKPESKAQLDEMAKLLNSNPALKVYIVGHTDSQGQFAHNLDLSQRRADAVAQSLTGTYHIAQGRLAAKGVASLAPVTTNDSDDGRAQNRRVELVQQ